MYGLFFILTSMFIMAPFSEGATIRSSYVILKEDFPSFISQLYEYNVSDVMIERYLNDVDQELEELGPLNQDNFNNLLYQAVSNLLSGGEHGTMYSAMFNILGSDIWEIVDRKLPERWVPFRDAVKESMLGSELSGQVILQGLPYNANNSKTTITLYNRQTSQYRSYTTNNMGFFRIAGLLNPGDYALKAHRIGFLAVYTQLTVGESGSIIDLGSFELKPGDINNDGIINNIDLAMLANCWGKSDTQNGFDFNEDNIVDIYDIVSLAKNWAMEAIDPIPQNI